MIKKLILLISPLVFFCMNVYSQVFVRLENPDFSYSYKTVYDINSTQYVVSSSNFQRVDEGINMASMWALLAFAQPSEMIQKFVFDNSTVEIALNFNIVGGSGVNTGTAAVYASKDGTAWVILSQRGSGQAGGVQYYNSILPTSLTGTAELWLKTTLQTDGPASWDTKFAQFSRGLSTLNSPASPIYHFY